MVVIVFEILILIVMFFRLLCFIVGCYGFFWIVLIGNSVKNRLFIV